MILIEIISYKFICFYKSKCFIIFCFHFDRKFVLFLSFSKHNEVRKRKFNDFQTVFSKIFIEFEKYKYVRRNDRNYNSLIE